MIIHELTHYLQGWYDEALPFPTPKEQYYSYLKLRSEQQAFLIAAYFFTEKFSPPKFRKIISSGKPMNGKIDDLLNSHFHTSGYDVHFTWKSGSE